MREKILKIIEKDARISTKEIAERLGLQQEAVEEEIQAMEKEKIICGYSALINWEKTERDYVTALIEVRVVPQRDLGFDKIAERIYKFPEVKAVYLMSGGFDLTVIVEGKNIKDIAFFVSDKLSPLASILGTASHFVLKKYKEHGAILEGEKKGDERMIVSP